MQAKSAAATEAALQVALADQKEKRDAEWRDHGESLWLCAVGFSMLVFHSSICDDMFAQLCPVPTTFQASLGPAPPKYFPPSRWCSQHPQCPLTCCAASSMVNAGADMLHLAQEQNQQLQREHQQLLGQHEQLQGEHRRLQGEHRQLQGEHRQLQGKRRQLQREHQQLQGEHEQLQELREQDRQCNVNLWELNMHLRGLVEPTLQG